MGARRRLAGFEFGDEFGEEGLPGKGAAEGRREVGARFAGLSAEVLDVAEDGLDVAVGRGGGGITGREGAEDVGEVAGVRAEAEDGGAEVEEVVDFAGVKEADEGVAHGDDVEVGGGEGVGEAGEGLVGEAEDVRGGRAEAGELLDFGEFGAATDEAEEDVGLVGELTGGGEEGVEGVAGAVVAGVHDDEFGVEAVGFAEGVAAGGGELDLGIVGPGRDDGDFAGRDGFGDEAVAHEAVEGDDFGGVSEAEAGEGVEGGGERA